MEKKVVRFGDDKFVDLYSITCLMKKPAKKEKDDIYFMVPGAGVVYLTKEEFYKIKSLMASQ